MNQKHKRLLLSLLPLLAIALLCVLLIQVFSKVNADRVYENRKQHQLAVIKDVIRADYDNDIFNDTLDLVVPASINSRGKLSVYVARLDGKVQALAFLPVETKGYSGTISMVAGLNRDGSISGVKILDHNETAGFGANAHQENSDWLTRFTSAALANTKESDWTTRKEGGKFDQLSGATITSRSIINSMHDLLLYYADNQKEFGVGPID